MDVNFRVVVISVTALTLSGCELLSPGTVVEPPGPSVSEPATSIAMWFRPYRDSATPDAVVRTGIPGESQAIELPRELGDQIEFKAVHFSDPQTGVALVHDRDGNSGHVLAYDAQANAWSPVAQVTDPVVVAEMSPWPPRFNPMFPMFAVRSWADGSWAVALGVTDAQDFTQRIWSVSSTGGAAPIEQWTSLDPMSEPLLDPAARMVLSVVGMTSPTQISAVAVSEHRHQPSQAAFMTVDLTTGIPTAHRLEGVSGVVRASGYMGSADYFVADAIERSDAPGNFEYRVTRYCRAEVCSTPSNMGIPTVGAFPFVVSANSSGPVAFVKIGDVRSVEPVSHTVNLPTSSSEMELRAILPDPANPNWIRIFAFDGDIEHRPFEYLFKPESGEVTEVTTGALAPVMGCVFDETQAFQTACFGVMDQWQQLRPKSFFFPIAP